MKDSGSNKWWIFWTVLAVLLGIFLYGMTGFPIAGVGKTVKKPTAIKAVAINSADLNKISKMLPNDDSVPTDADKLIAFTKKTVCRRNVEIINTMVEFWNIKHEGLWPRSDLSDIGRDKDYFPKGLPVCAVDGSPYSLDPLTHRVLGHDHSDIKFNYKDIKVFSGDLKKSPKGGKTD
jgi:hypothetical protein